MMRPRRESRLAQSFRPDQPLTESPSNSRSRGRRPEAVQEDEFAITDDRSPLLINPIHNGSIGGYGAGEIRSPYSMHQNMDNMDTTSSRRSPQNSYMPDGLLAPRQEYDVNNPPSMPGSPKMGPDLGYDSTMITGPGFIRSQSPEAMSASSLPMDAVINIDTDTRRPGGPSRRTSTCHTPPELVRRRTVALPVEEDVCFPTGGLSDLGEEDLQSRAQAEGDTRGRRRRARRVWPDLSALDEWSQQEKEARSGAIRSKRISEPVLIGGRLRTRNLVWKHDEEEEAPYRFTYFNEDFQSTLHSQTLSELEQPGQTFRDLFIPEPPILEDESSEDEDDFRPYNGAMNRDRTQSTSTYLNHNTNNIPDLLSDNADGASSKTANDHSRKDSQPKETRYGPRPTFWLDVLSPTDSEMRVISKAFGIHALTAEDIMMQEAREKVELFRNYYFINYRTFEQDVNSPDFLEPVNMYVVVFREGLLSFHFSRTPHPANVRRRIRQLKDYLILSADWISYAIIDDITDVFGPLIHAIEEEVDEIDDIILRLHSDSKDMRPDRNENNEKTAALEASHSGSNMLRQVGSCRKKVMGLYRLLGNKADVIKGFAKRCNEYWEVAPKSEIGLYLGDIQDHILTMTSNLTHYETLLSRAHSNYLAQINIRMNERQEQTADVLGKLTVLGTIVLPMNIICGMWGMNVKVPGQDIENLNWFWSITAGLVVFAVVCFYVAKRVYRIV
ncbi:manganese resistance protein MNR2 [Arthroderma uncinatum]|uniref:manganese resistance protein MNR2 n=1 Tax=Arthroderma uncinatum TaxID=74035 RepID=UPI00144A97E1|nr:manganese resistance protein MNR2 [Arthroderma uncinatum]KAF3491173.1 manganese resistance protein MNR2 [Arthroderma uncinatum]